MRTTATLVASALARLDEAVRLYQPSKVIALFSGGYDSLCATHVTAQHPRFAGVLHINTGIGIPQTRHFVRATCQAYGWPLLEYRSPIRYEDIVLTQGFPGPSVHTIVYSKLKERALRLFMRDHKTHLHDRVLLSTGARSEESRRRMGHAQALRREDTRVWVNPLLEWTKDDILDYMEDQRLPHNEVVDIMHMSGECLCGCFASEGELDLLEAFFPEVASYIHNLERRAQAAGVPCRWGHEPPAAWVQSRRGQLSLPGCDTADLPLCTSCDARFARRQEERQIVVPSLQPVAVTLAPIRVTLPPLSAAPSLSPYERETLPGQGFWGPWREQEQRLLERLCAEHGVPTELMRQLLAVERDYAGRADRSGVQADLDRLISQDWPASTVSPQAPLAGSPPLILSKGRSAARRRLDAERAARQLELW